VWGSVLGREGGGGGGVVMGVGAVERKIHKITDRGTGANCLGEPTRVGQIFSLFQKVAELVRDYATFKHSQDRSKHARKRKSGP